MKKISLIPDRDSIIVYTIKLFALISVIFLTVGCGSRKTIDTVTPMVKSLPLLTKDQPGPLWQSTIQAREMDIIQYLSNNRILVGTLGLENILGVHHRYVRKELILVNATNGTVIWKYPRSAVGGDSQAVLTVDPVVLLQGVYAKKSKYQAIDPVSGKLVWEREVQAPKGIAQVTSHGSIIFTSSVGSSLELVSVKLKDGSEAWKSKIEKYSLEENMQPDLMLSGQDLIITGPEVVKLSVTDGRIDWRKPFIGTFNSFAISIFQGKNLFCSDGTKLSMIDTESGIPVWSSSLSDGNIKLIGPAEDSVLLLIVMTSGDQPVRTIRSVDRKSGKLLWSVTLKEELRSPFLIDEQILRCSTKSQLMALKLKTGDLLWNSIIPLSLQSERGLPDLFVLDDRKIILVREVGAAAFSMDDGRLLFSERIDGGLLFTNDYLTNRYSECVQSLVMSSKKNIGGQQAGTNIPKFQTSDAFYKMALAQKQYIYSSTESAMRSGSRAERASAIGKRSMATNAALGQAQIQAYADLMQASSQIGAGIGLVIAKAIAVKLDATVQPHNEESMKFMLSEIAHSQTIHNYSIQGNFYIRPYYKEGWKLALVDLNNGNRADIILHPPNEALVFAANLPAFAMDPGGKNLIVKGLGIDSNRYETHELICHEDIVRDPYAGRNFTIPYPSLLFYDVSRFKYVKNDIRNIPPGIAHAINTQNADLISAAFYGDFETVVKLLNKGADINAVDEYGHTALMHATQILNDGMIKLLLERGADITIVDANGLTAYDYIFLPITKISNENLVPVVKLFMKASKNLKNKE